MRYFGMLAGPRIAFAPETDEGSEPDDLDEDFSLDEPDEEPDEDEPVDEDLPDEDLDLDADTDPEPPRQSRADNRVAKATRAAKELRERLDRQERELAELRASQNRPQEPQETPAQREQRLANMDPYERLQYELNETRQQTQATLQSIRFEAQNNADKTSFEGLCQREPTASKLKAEVESRFANFLKSGTYIPRETIYTHLLGERARANAGRATSKARKTAAGNLDRNQARPVSGGRGDAAPDSRRSGNAASARDKRVENYSL